MDSEKKDIEVTFEEEKLRSKSLSSLESLDSIEDNLAGQKMFLTGATGMMGVSLLSRLALDTPIEKIYALSRGGTERLWNRLGSLLPAPMVEKMKCQGKIIGVDGDICKPNMGIDDTILDIMKDEVTIVVHTASTLHLKNKLPKIAENVIFPSLAMADLALSCKQLNKFVYVSTAYTNAFLHFKPGAKIEDDCVIHERFYPLRSNSEENAQGELRNIMEFGTTPEYSEMGHPFSYSYAKHLTERLISEKFAKADRANDLLIFRPSCFGPAEKRPFPGFETSGSVPVTTVMASLFACPPGVCTNFASSLPNPKSANVDEVPVDVVVDRLIVHVAVKTTGVVHAVSGPKRRSVHTLLRAGCKLRSFWWGAPKLRWCAADTDPSKVSFISKTFGVLGCSLLFRSDQTQRVWDAMRPDEQQKWHLWTQRDPDDITDLVDRSVIARDILQSFMYKKHKIPPWVTSMLSKRPRKPTTIEEYMQTPIKV